MRGQNAEIPFLPYPTETLAMQARGTLVMRDYSILFFVMNLENIFRDPWPEDFA